MTVGYLEIISVFNRVWKKKDWMMDGWMDEIQNQDKEKRERERVTMMAFPEIKRNSKRNAHQCEADGRRTNRTDPERSRPRKQDITYI